METKVKINVSARHVHLTKEAIDILIGHDLTIKNELKQKGQFAANETVSIRTKDGLVKENVRIVGPARSYNQVEISKSDARGLKLNPPVRTSGDIVGSEYLTIFTDRGEVAGEFCIIADRHVHMSPEDASILKVLNSDVLKLVITGEKPGVIDVKAKVSDDGYFEVHLDTDDANAFLIEAGDTGTLIK